MAHTFKITGVETVYIQSSNDNQIEVAVDIFDGTTEANEAGEQVPLAVKKLRFGYPLDSTPQSIREDLAKVCTTLDSDKEIGEASAVLEEQLANAALIKESLMSE